MASMFEHRQQARLLLAEADRIDAHEPVDHEAITRVLARAQVHATLALSAEMSQAPAPEQPQDAAEGVGGAALDLADPRILEALEKWVSGNDEEMTEGVQAADAPPFED